MSKKLRWWSLDPIVNTRGQWRYRWTLVRVAWKWGGMIALASLLPGRKIVGSVSVTFTSPQGLARTTSYHGSLSEIAAAIREDSQQIATDVEQNGRAT